jgi:hypothetical protein
MGFQSPSYNLMELMTKRREQSFKEMLDNLRAEDMRSQMAERELNNQATRDWREAQAENQRTIAFDRRLGNLPDDVDMDSLDPEFAKRLEQEGYVGRRPDPSMKEMLDVDGQKMFPSGHSMKGVDGSGMVPAPPDSLMPSDQKFFKGDRKSQQAKARSAALHKLMLDPNFKNMAPDEKALHIIRAAGEGQSDDLMQVLIQQSMREPDTDQPVYRINRDTGQAEPLTGPDNKPIMGKGKGPIFQPWNPPEPRVGGAGSAADRPAVHSVQNPETKEWESYWLRPGEQPNDSNKINAPTRRGNPPPVPKRTSRLSDQDRKLFTDAKKLIDQKKGKSFQWLNGPSAKETADFEAQRNRILSKFADVPGVVKVALALVDDPKTVYEIVSDPDIPENMRADLAELLTMLRSGRE